MGITSVTSALKMPWPIILHLGGGVFLEAHGSAGEQHTHVDDHAKEQGDDDEGEECGNQQTADDDAAQSLVKFAT